MLIFGRTLEDSLSGDSRGVRSADRCSSRRRRGVVGLTRPSREQLKFCAKMGLAAALAYLFTQGERNQYALYAVFTAALVLGSNVGEDLVSSWNRVAGTVMGAATGMVVAVLMGPSVSAVAVGQC